MRLSNSRQTTETNEDLPKEVEKKEEVMQEEEKTKEVETEIKAKLEPIQECKISAKTQANNIIRCCIGMFTNSQVT